MLTPQGHIIPNSGHGGMSYVVKASLLTPFMRQQDKPLFATVNGQDMVALKELKVTRAARWSSPWHSSAKEEQHGNRFDQLPGWRTLHLRGYP